MHSVTPTPLQLRHQLLALCLCLALAPAPAWAQKRVALVLGNAQYQHETTLRNPIYDARLLERTLRAKPLNFHEVLTLDNGTRGQMLQQLARFGKLAQGADVAVLYYSGHGMINSKRQNHLLPVDMPKISANADLDTDAALKAYGISETELIEAVEGAKVQVVVLDACRDNGFGGTKSGTKGLARRPDQSKNRLIAYATEEGFTAEDGKGLNSTYAQSLAKHLVRTDLPLLTVFDEVANDVERQTANKQSPTRSGNLRTSVYLLASLVPEPVQPPAPRPVDPSPAPVPAPTPVATNRLTRDAVLVDEGIEIRSFSRIRDVLGERGHVNVTSVNREVLLTGEVASAQDKQHVEQIVTGLDNVRHVINELAVLGNSTLGQRSSDVLVTGRVRAALIDARDLSVNAFKIATERGTTYVMGRVTTREAKRATEIISATKGVQRVFRIFEIISEEELARIQETLHNNN
jgi:osmotically-inducible protein OsmY